MLIPPIVEPVARLDPAEARRTLRQQAVLGVGELGQRRIAAARVLVVGAGGLGSPVVQYLAGAGVGRIDVVDSDVVEEHNLARQLLYTRSDLGASKATALAAAAGRVAPAGEVVPHVVHLDANSIDAVLDAAAPHLVIDTTDDWSTRFLVADTCAARDLPLVWGSVVGTDGQVTVLWPARPGAPGLDDLLDRELAVQSTISCAGSGVLGPLCGQIGAMLAGEAIALVTGVGEPLVGRVAIVDARTARTREIPLAPRASRSPSPAPVRDDRPVERDHEHEHGHGRGHGRGHEHVLAVPRVGLAELDRPTLDDGPALLLVDLRDDPHPALPVPATRCPLHVLTAAAADGTIAAVLEPGRRLVLVCEQGPRARFAARTLLAVGYADVAVLDGGVGALLAPTPIPPGGPSRA